MNSNMSEVAQLVQQIRSQYEAAERGLSGLAYGVSQHKFITARMERVGKVHEEITRLIGEEEATKIIVDLLESDGV